MAAAINNIRIIIDPALLLICISVPSLGLDFQPGNWSTTGLPVRSARFFHPRRFAAGGSVVPGIFGNGGSGSAPPRSGCNRSAAGRRASRARESGPAHRFSVGVTAAGRRPPARPGRPPPHSPPAPAASCTATVCRRTVAAGTCTFPARLVHVRCTSPKRGSSHAQSTSTTP